MRGRPTAGQAEAITRTILRAATDIFLEKGFEAATMDGVAERAGVPKSTLYKRFADKKALLRSVIEARVSVWAMATSQEAWMLTDDLEQRLKQYCVWMLTWASSPDVRAFSALAANAWSAADEARLNSDLLGFGRMVEVIEDDIRRFGPQAGIVAKDPNRIAMTLMAMLSGWLQLNAYRQPVSGTETAAFANTIVELLVHGQAAW